MRRFARRFPVTLGAGLYPRDFFMKLRFLCVLAAFIAVPASASPLGDAVKQDYDGHLSLSLSLTLNTTSPP